METKKIPLGILVLGGLNSFIFGAVTLIFCAILYQKISSSGAEEFLQELKRHFSHQNLTSKELRVAVLFQSVMSTVFMISGAGLLRRKEWGRRLTLYIAFFVAASVLISVLFNPVFIRQAIAQILYPAILVFYFTNKKVESYFVPAKNGEAEVIEE